MGVRSDLATARGLRSRCSLFRAELADRGTSAEVLRAHWPGGRDNPDHGLAGWIFCYGSYRTLLDGGRLDDQEAEDAQAQRLEQVLLDASRDRPARVELTPVEGETRAVQVYPKGYDALCLVDELDAVTRWLLAHAAVLAGRDDAEAALRYREAMREVSLNHQTMAWIACTPGPEAPFTGLDLPDTVPSPFHALSPADLIRILQAYHQVNRRRHAEIAAALHGGQTDGPGGRGSWVSLAASAAERFKERIEDLLRRRSLGAWLSQLVVTVRDERAAAARREDR